MGAIPQGPPPRQLTDQERSEAEFQRQLTRMVGRQQGRTETWIRTGLLVSVVAWAIWSAGQMSETVRAWLQ